MHKVAGIDYGARYSGKTVICVLEQEELRFYRPAVKEDADKFVTDFLLDFRPNVIAIDAPLSLPSAYFDEGSDYMYRSSDRILKAMSPMFLGGLTARAIQLMKSLPNFEWIETYPSHHVRETLAIPKKTKESLGLAIRLVRDLSGRSFGRKPADWHELDASLCWHVAAKYVDGAAKKVGDKSEGLIHL